MLRPDSRLRAPICQRPDSLRLHAQRVRFATGLHSHVYVLNLSLFSPPFATLGCICIITLLLVAVKPFFIASCNY